MRTYFDPLEHFAKWWLTQPVRAALFVPPLGIREVDIAMGIVLYRQPPFQVECFIVPPGKQFEEFHRHPDVDSYEVPLFGKLYFNINGEPVLPDDMVDQLAAAGWPPDTVPPQRVRPSDWHGSRVGTEGAVFLSVQMWLRSIVPTSVTQNWEGAALGDTQRALWQAQGLTGAGDATLAPVKLGTAAVPPVMSIGI